MLPDQMRGVASGNAARPTARAVIPDAHPRTRGTGTQVGEGRHSSWRLATVGHDALVPRMRACADVRLTHLRHLVENGRVTRREDRGHPVRELQERGHGQAGRRLGLLGVRPWLVRRPDGTQAR